MPLRIVVLASGGGSLLQALLDAQTAGRLPAQIVAVGSDRPEAPALDRAHRAGIDTFVRPLENSADRNAWDTALAEDVAAHHPDLVVSAGFMKILGAPFLQQFGGRIINTHPAPLPQFPGSHAVRDVLAAGVPESAATVIWVDAGIDTGEIIASIPVPVLPGDDEETLHERTKVVERELLIATIRRLAGEGPELQQPEARRPIKRALVSVYDKSGLIDLGRALEAAGVEIVSTGSTAGALETAGVPVTRVEKVTGFPECLDGRVKTLHPKIHAGLLGDMSKENHRAQLEELAIQPFDLLVSNLYPFAETVASGAQPAACIEQIDIGGPAMVRSSAKNHASVAVITSPQQYPQLMTALKAGGFTLAERQALAGQAFIHTATYDVQVASWMSGAFNSGHDSFPNWFGGTWAKVADLRYGENSHQPAAIYRNSAGPGGLAAAVQHGGKEMSFNNYVDASAARRAAYDFTEPCVAIIKHANPCGIAVGADVAEAHRKAHACDPTSAFGGVIATNRPVSVELAQQIAPIFTEVVVGPAYEDGALEILQGKKNLRILEAGAPVREGLEVRDIDGGILLQRPDFLEGVGDDPLMWTLVCGEPADEATLADLAFAWRACRAVKSNAILLAAGGASVGVGMGQVNRVDSCRLAVQRAGERAQGAVAASDAFFPFADGLQILIDGGVRAVVHPGGSIRDAEVTEAAKAAGLTMYHTGTRHFAH